MWQPERALALLGRDREGFAEEVAILKERVVTGCKERMGKDFPGKGQGAHEG